MLKEKLDVLSQMMAEHMAMPFPPGCRGLDIEGEDMVMLDADAYGFASGVLAGPLSEQRRSGLTRLTQLGLPKKPPMVNAPSRSHVCTSPPS